MFDTVGPFGKSVDDLAYLLDILIPNQDYRSKFHSGLSTLSIGIGGPANHTLEEQNLYRKAQDCLASGDKVHIVAHEIQFNLLQQATSENSAVTIMSAGLERAMGEYLTGVSGPIRTLRDIVNWHSMHPVSLDRTKWWETDISRRNLSVQRIQDSPILKMLYIRPHQL